MPDGRHLVFSGDIGENSFRLYMVDSESDRIEPLTATTSEESDPAVSPDGKRIAFASGAEDFDLVELPLDGSRSRTLLATARDERMPAWSPSGSQYAYVTKTNTTWEIWLRNRQDGSSRLLVRGDPAISGSALLRPRFSPDGGRISYDLLGPKHVVAISSVAGGSPVILDPESTDHHGASWSPDGNWIAYRRLKAGKWELAKAPLGGGDPVSLGETISGGTANTDWSPDGKWICHPRDDGFYLVSADGKTQKMLNTTAVSYGFSRDSAIVWQ
jgi:Tol biopolymer transport system component